MSKQEQLNNYEKNIEKFLNKMISFIYYVSKFKTEILVGNFFALIVTSASFVAQNTLSNSQSQQL